MNLSKKNYLKEKIKLENKQRDRNDRLLKVFIGIFVIGYLFFFNSNLFMPKVYRYKEVTPIGAVLDLEDYVLTFDTWDYSKKDHSFEIIFDVQNLTLDNDADYKFIVRRGDKIYKTEVYKKMGDMVVVRAKGVPRRWTECMLSVQAGSKSTNIRMNDKEVNRVRSIRDRSNKEYRRYAATRKLDGMRASIKRIRKQMSERDKRLKIAHEKLEDLEKMKNFQTEKEKETTDNQKSKIANEYDNLRAAQDEDTIKIEELKAKIKIQEGILEKMKG